MATRRRHPGRRAATWLASLALALVANVGLAGPAAAHAQLLSSDPSPGANLAVSPRDLILVFSERPDPALSVVALADAHGVAVVTGKVGSMAGHPEAIRVSLPVLQTGVYTVHWRSVSAVDGDVESGSFWFGVRATPGSSNGGTGAAAQAAQLLVPSAVIGRWLVYLGLCLLIGTAFVATVIHTVPPSSSTRLALAGWLAAMIGLITVIATQAATLQIGLPALLSTSLGRVAILRAIPMLVVGLFVASQWGRQRPTVRSIAAIGIAAAGGLLVDAGTSHAAAGGAAHPSHLDVFVQWLHVGAVGTWLGGLVALLVSLRGQLPATAAPAVRRFASSASIGIGVVAVSGVLRAVAELRSPADLLGTDFGRLLVAKSALFLALAGLGALNHFFSVPSAGRTLGPLRMIGRLELSIAAGVLLLSAALVNLPPPVH